MCEKGIVWQGGGGSFLDFFVDDEVDGPCRKISYCYWDDTAVEAGDTLFFEDGGEGSPHAMIFWFDEICFWRGFVMLQVALHGEEAALGLQFCFGNVERTDEKGGDAACCCAGEGVDRGLIDV